MLTRAQSRDTWICAVGLPKLGKTMARFGDRAKKAEVFTSLRATCDQPASLTAPIITPFALAQTGGK
jgi:hypothetical protein